MSNQRSTAEPGRRSCSTIFEIGDRVRLRLHPDWEGTVVARSLQAYSVDWDNHGVETVHGELLDLIAARESRAAS